MDTTLPLYGPEGARRRGARGLAGPCGLRGDGRPKAGYTIRVAVIQSRSDLGAAPELCAKPQLYAKFLDAELRSAGHLGALAVVTPHGFGVAPGGRLSLARSRGSSGR